MIRRAMGMTGLGLAVWLSACSSGSSGGGASTPEGACDEFVGALCNKLTECLPLTIRISYKDANDCIARQKSQCVKSLNAPSTGLTPSFLSGCAAAYQSASCDNVFVQPDACKTPAGQLADGAPCGEDSQCSGRSCNRQANGTCGACTTWASAGGDCTTNDCADGLRCAGNGKCVAPASAGGTCGENQPCVSGLVCSKGTCGAGAAAGVSCADGTACDSLKGLFCDPTSKTCKEVKIGSPGESCGFVGGTLVACAAGGKCKGSSGTTTPGTCQAAAADGAACNEETGPDCQSPAECINGVCTVPDPGACK